MVEPDGDAEPLLVSFVLSLYLSSELQPENIEDSGIMFG